MNKPFSCADCPMYETGHGFVLDWGDPRTAKIMLQLEAPGATEITYSLERTQNKPREQILSDRIELERRSEFYDFPRVHYTTGVALVGRSWLLLEAWVLRPYRIKREDCYISNTLRCVLKSGAYPTGKTRVGAESFCRQYDLPFKPDLYFIGPHPAAIFQDMTMLPILRNTFRKVADCVAQGLKPCVLLGEKAAAQRLGSKRSSMRKLHGAYWWAEKGPKVLI